MKSDYRNKVTEDRGIQLKTDSYIPKKTLWDFKVSAYVSKDR